MILEQFKRTGLDDISGEVRFIPAVSPHLYIDKDHWAINKTSLSFNRDADPIWTESNWPEDTLQVHFYRHEDTSWTAVFPLLLGIAATATTIIVSTLVRQRIQTRLVKIL